MLGFLESGRLFVSHREQREINQRWGEIREEDVIRAASVHGLSPSGNAWNPYLNRHPERELSSPTEGTAMEKPSGILVSLHLIGVSGFGHHSIRSDRLSRA